MMRIEHLESGKCGKKRNERSKVLKSLVGGNAEKDAEGENKKFAPKEILIVEILSDVVSSVKPFSEECAHNQNLLSKSLLL